MPSMVSAFAPQLPQHFTSFDAGATKTTSSLLMFTGIIEEMGTVMNLEQRDDMTLWDGSKGSGTELTVKGDIMLDGAYLG